MKGERNILIFDFPAHPFTRDGQPNHSHTATLHLNMQSSYSAGDQSRVRTAMVMLSSAHTARYFYKY